MPDNFLGSIGCRRSLEDSDGYKNGMTTEFRRMELFIRVPAVPGGQIDNGRGVCRELWSEPDGHSPTALCPPWINHKRLGVKVICLWDSFPSFSLHFWPPGFPQSAVAVGATSDLTTIALPLRWHCFFSPLSLLLLHIHDFLPSCPPDSLLIVTCTAKYILSSQTVFEKITAWVLVLSGLPPLVSRSQSSRFLPILFTFKLLYYSTLNLVPMSCVRSESSQFAPHPQSIPIKFLRKHRIWSTDNKNGWEQTFFL